MIISCSRVRKLPSEELANESRSTHITVAADMVFSLSHYLSGVCLSFPVVQPHAYFHHLDRYCGLCSSFE